VEPSAEEKVRERRLRRAALRTYTELGAARDAARAESALAAG